MSKQEKADQKNTGRWWGMSRTFITECKKWAYYEFKSMEEVIRIMEEMSQAAYAEFLSFQKERVEKEENPDIEKIKEQLLSQKRKFLVDIAKVREACAVNIEISNNLSQEIF
jgi:hypothetical protein